MLTIEAGYPREHYFAWVRENGNDGTGELKSASYWSS